MFFLIFRYVPSQADTVVFDAISSPPPADLVHALRWYNHIKSFQKGRWGKCIDPDVVTCTTWMSVVMKTLCISLPGVKKPLGQYGPPGVADTTSASKPAAKKDDDDDIDLFGSDEEVGHLPMVPLRSVGGEILNFFPPFRKMKRLPG